MFYYRYREKGKDWSDMFNESSERRCRDNLYGTSDCLDVDIEYEIYESDLIDSGTIEVYVLEDEECDDFDNCDVLDYVLNEYVDNKSIEDIKEEMRTIK